MVTCSYSFLSNLQFALKYILNIREIAIYMPFYLFLLATFVSFYIILISELYCKSLWFPTRAPSFNTPNLLNTQQFYLPIFIFLHPFSTSFSLCTLLTQCSPYYSIFAFLLNAIYFPLSRARGPSHLSKLCIYINYVYSTMPRCARLLPSTMSMRTSYYEMG